MRNVWKGMIVGALIGAGLDGAIEAGRRGRVVGRKAGQRGREVAHTAAEKVDAAAHTAADKIDAADLPAPVAAARDKLHDIAG
ncbi:MAG TPA: hypothetical protein VGO03_08280 [Acidimicrobiia bacterium]|jgi:uncharacterized membrane protein